MDEIRKALAQVRERIEAHQAYDAIEALDEALLLLPPEGETREGYMTHEQAKRYHQKLVDQAEPAPSSEKELYTEAEMDYQMREEGKLRDTIDQLRDSRDLARRTAVRFQRSEKALRELLAAVTVSDFCGIICNDVWIEGKKANWFDRRDALLASPAVTQDKSAPEATKEERKPNLRDYDFEDLADYNPD